MFSRGRDFPLFLATSWLWVMLAVLVMGPGVASAQGEPLCEEPVQKWASRCASDESMTVSPHRCVSGFATFRAEHEGAILDIELRAHPKGTFRTAGTRGISPIGEFADWSAAPSSLRTALDKFATCVERGVPDAVFGGKTLFRGEKSSSTSDGSPPIPWRLIGAAFAIGIVLASFAKRMRPMRIVHTVAPLIALGMATWLFRRFVFEAAFFHQNGHGAMWVDCALGGRCGYGPGFRELFGFFARADIARAEQGVFFAQSLLAATSPISAWVIARAIGGPRVVAWAAAFVMAIEPGLGRLAASESYFGVATWLLLAAAALLAGAARIGHSTSVAFASAMIGAGLLLGQAAVVHPIAWIPSALVPLVVLVGRGSFRRRLRLFFVALVGTGSVALISSAPILLRVYGEHRRWGESIGSGFLPHLINLLPTASMTVAILFGLWTWGRRWPGLGRNARLRRLMVGIVVLLATVALASGLHPFDAQALWIQHVAWSPYFPVIIASVAAMASAVSIHRLPTRWAALLIAAVGIAYSVVNWQKLTVLPTDVLESKLASVWREELPEGARVFHLERAGMRISTLPVYKSSPREILLVRLRHEGAGARLAMGSARAGDFYYRSSLCSGEEVRPLCDELERSFQLEPVRLDVLPARPSMPYLLYDTDEVHVGLYRIKASRSSAQR